MKSQFGDSFNHDPWADEYDLRVKNEDDPIRAGYEAVLDWVIEQARITSQSHVLDLGIGTGNLSMRISQCASLMGVDLSSKMLEQAKPKLKHLKRVDFVKADVLSYLAACDTSFDAIISTYTIHHLTGPEKHTFHKLVWEHLKPGGYAVFGDLMVSSEQTEQELLDHFRKHGHHEVAEDMEEEFFWYVDSAITRLQELGFHTGTKRFSKLSWGIYAKRDF